MLIGRNECLEEIQIIANYRIASKHQHMKPKELSQTTEQENKIIELLHQRYFELTNSRIDKRAKFV